MTPAEAKRFLKWCDDNRAAIEAASNGRNICKMLADGVMRELDASEEMYLGYDYEPAPEPKTRHYTDAELKEQVGKVLQRKSTGDTHLVTGHSVQNKTLSISLFGSVRADTVLDEFTHKDGSPCGVTE